MKKQLSLVVLLASGLAPVYCKTVESKTVAVSKTKGIKETKKQHNIRRIFELTICNDNFKNSLSSQAEHVYKQFEQVKDEAQRNELKAIVEGFNKNMMSEFYSDAMIDQFGEIYNTVYTEKDIEEMLKFYESPVGKKTLQKMPEVMQMTMSVMNPLIQKHAVEFSQKIEQFQKKYTPVVKPQA